MSALMVRYWNDGCGGRKPVAGLARTAQRAVPTMKPTPLRFPNFIFTHYKQRGTLSVGFSLGTT